MIAFGWGFLVGTAFVSLIAVLASRSRHPRQPQLPDWRGPGVRVVSARMADGYVPPSASMNPDATTPAPRPEDYA